MRTVKARVYTKHEARKLIPVFLNCIALLKESKFRFMKILGDTLESWQEEIVRMWSPSRWCGKIGVTDGA